MNSRLIEDGVYTDEAGDPDLESAFREFSESIREQDNAEGTIKVYRVPLDAQGKPRSNTLQYSMLFDAPVDGVDILRREGGVDRVQHRQLRERRHTAGAFTAETPAERGPQMDTRRMCWS